MTIQNLWDSVKAVLRGRFIVIESYLKKHEKNQINNFTPKATRKRRNEEPQGQWKERNHEIQEINK